MISVVNAVPVLLFVLGTLCHTAVDIDMDRSNCLSRDFLYAELDRCFHSQGLPVIKPLGDPEFVSSISNFANSIEDDICGTQVLTRVKEAYHCFYNSCSDCYDEFLADPANSVDNDFRRFVQDLELYAPDPDMFGDALRGICELSEEEDWSCYDDDKERRLLLCGLGEVQAMISKLRFNKQSPVKTFKPAMCEMFSGFQRCTTDHLQGCPQKTVSTAGRMVNLLIPLGCHIHGTTGMKQDEERQAESPPTHDDL